jgi:hypothetical protein
MPLPSSRCPIVACIGFHRSMFTKSLPNNESIHHSTMLVRPSSNLANRLTLRELCDMLPAGKDMSTEAEEYLLLEVVSEDYIRLRLSLCNSDFKCADR